MASTFFQDNPNLVSEILVKPDEINQYFLNIESIIKNIGLLKEFSIVGFTEKELGINTNERLLNLARIRNAMISYNINTPIHIFGCMDPIATPLYFLFGADLFDGLNWIRFAFHKGRAVYHSNYSELKHEGKSPDKDAFMENLFSNYFYMKDLQIEMSNFLTTLDFSEFEHNGELFEKIYNLLLRGEHQNGR